MPRPMLHPDPLALTIILAAPTPFLHVAPIEQASIRDYYIATELLVNTLDHIAAQTGLTLTLDSALVEGRSAYVAQDRFDAPDTLRETLKGSGPELVENAGDIYSPHRVPEDILSL